jgi:hypothetical protein
MFHAVTFPHVRATRPETFADTWAGFVARLEHRERDHKGGALYSCVKYAPGATRGNRGVTEISALVADLDGQQIASSNLHIYHHIAYTTWSHRPDDPHWHVVIPFAQAVPVEHWSSVWRDVHDRLALVGDEQTKDPARIFYLPQHAAGQPFEMRRGGTLFFDPTITGLATPQREWRSARLFERKRVTANSSLAKYRDEAWWRQPADLSAYAGLDREQQLAVMRARWEELKAANGWLVDH